MQYGVDIATYKRIGSNKDKNEVSMQWEVIKYISMFAIQFYNKILPMKMTPLYEL